MQSHAEKVRTDVQDTRQKWADKTQGEKKCQRPYKDVGGGVEVWGVFDKGEGQRQLGPLIHSS